MIRYYMMYGNSMIKSENDPYTHEVLRVSKKGDVMDHRNDKGLFLFLQESSLRTLLISGDVGTGKTHRVLRALEKTEKTHTIVTSHIDIHSVCQSIHIEATLEKGRVVERAHQWDAYDILLCEGLEHFDRSTWLWILHEQTRRYHEEKPLQIIATYTGTDELSRWAADMDIWIPLEEPTEAHRMDVLKNRMSDASSEFGQISNHCILQQAWCRQKIMVHDSIYTYISTIVQHFGISFMGMEYILLKAAIGLGKQRGHRFVEPNDVEDVIPWTIPQKIMDSTHTDDFQMDGQNDMVPSNYESLPQDGAQCEHARKHTENEEDDLDREYTPIQAAENIQSHEGYHENSSGRTDGLDGNEVHLSEQEKGEENQQQTLDVLGASSVEEQGGQEQEKGPSCRGKSLALSQECVFQVEQLYHMLQPIQKDVARSVATKGVGPTHYRYGREGISIAWIPTCIEAIRRKREVPIQLTLQDLRYYFYKKKPHEAVYLVVDASGSMGRRKSVWQTKKLLSQLVHMIYVKRQYVSLIIFQKGGAQCLVPLTNHVETILRALETAHTGGRTPFLKGLEEAVLHIEIDQLHIENVKAELILVTDGKVTAQALQGLDAIGVWLAEHHVKTTVVDTDTDFIHLNRSETIATILGARYVKAEHVI